MDYQTFYDFGVSFLPIINKEPAIVNGEQIGVTKATRIKETIAKWQSLNLDLAVAGGDLVNNNNFLVIIDVDVKKENGDQTLLELEKSYGPLPATFTIKTPSGGRHLYFLSNERIGSSVDAFRAKFGQKSGIDIKGHHGYVVAIAQGYEIDKNISLETLPEQWKLLLLSLVKQRDQYIAETLDTYSQPPDWETVKKFNSACSIEDALEHWGYVKTGPRTYCHPDDATSTHNVTIIENTRIMKVGADLVSYHWGANDMVQGGPHDAVDIFKIRQFDGDWTKTLAWIKNISKDESEEDSCHTHRLGGTIKQIYTYLESQPPQEELIENHFRRQQLIMSSGDSGCFKTFDLMAQAYSGATGFPYLNHFPVRKFRSVLILTESNNDFKVRSDAWIRKYAALNGASEQEVIDRIDENVFIYFKPIYVNDEKSREQFELFKEKYASGFKADFWGIDHLANNFQGEENSNTEMKPFLSFYLNKAFDEDAAVNILCHTTKEGIHLRGAGCQRNNPTNVFIYSRKKNEYGCYEGAVTKQYEKVQQDEVPPFYELTFEVFDLYPDEGAINPKMRKGLVVLYKSPTVEPTTPAEEEQDHLPIDEQFSKLSTEGKILYYLTQSQNTQYPMEGYKTSKQIITYTKISGATVTKALTKLIAEGKIKKRKTRWKNQHNYGLATVATTTENDDNA